MLRNMLGAITIGVLLLDWAVAATIKARSGKNGRGYLTYEVYSCIFEIAVLVPWIIWGNLPTFWDTILIIYVVLQAMGSIYATTKLEEVRKNGEV
jgi:hypothetical protein